MRESWRSGARFWRDVVILPAWKWLVFVPLALLGAFQSIREELPSSVQHRVQLPDYVPTWPWWAWLLILYSLVLAIILESTFRLQRKQGTQQPSHPGAINIMGGQQNIY